MASMTVHSSLQGSPHRSVSPTPKTTSYQQLFKDYVLHSLKIAPSSHAFFADARNAQNLAADASWAVRSVFSFPNITIPHVSALTSGLGLTTGYNVSALASLKSQLSQLSHAVKQGDLSSTLDALWGVLMTIGQGIGGLVFLPVRVLTIITDLLNVTTSLQATTTLGLVTCGLGIAGGMLFNVMFLALSLMGGYGLGKGYLFLHQYNQCKTLQDKLSFLFDQIGLGKKSLAEFKKISSGEFTNLAMAEFDKMSQELHLSESDKDAFFLEVKEMLPEIGELLAQEHFIAKKERYFASIVGTEGLEAVKKAYETGLLYRLESKDSKICAFAVKEVQTLDLKVRSVVSRTLRINWSLVGMGLLGVFSGLVLAGLFATPAGWVLAGCIATVALVALMAGFDFYAWKSGLQNSAPGKYDKALSIALMVLLTASIVATGGLAGVFGLSMMATVALVTTGVASIAFMGYNHYKICKKEKTWKEEHPVLNHDLRPDAVKKLQQEDQELLYKMWEKLREFLSHKDEQASLEINKEAIERTYVKMHRALAKGEVSFKSLEKVQRLYQQSLTESTAWIKKITPSGRFRKQKEYLLAMRNEESLRTIALAAIQEKNLKKDVSFESLQTRAQSLFPAAKT